MRNAHSQGLFPLGLGILMFTALLYALTFPWCTKGTHLSPQQDLSIAVGVTIASVVS